MLGAFCTDPGTPASRQVHVRPTRAEGLTGLKLKTAEYANITFIYRPACRIIQTGGRSTLSPRTALSSKGSCEFCKTLLSCTAVRIIV